MDSQTPLPIAPGRVVAIHYTLYDENGEVIDASEEQPIGFLHGADNVVTGLEEGLLGACAGERRSVPVSPEKGYGVRDENAVQKVPRENFPDDADIEPGLPLGAQDPEGRQLTVWILAVDDGGVTLDLNHPLAGKQLRFEVLVDDVREATPDELIQGRPNAGAPQQTPEADGTH